MRNDDTYSLSRVSWITMMLAVISFLLSCGTSTQITGSWKAVENPQYFEKLAIIGITPRAQGRKAIEEKMEQLLIDQGINAIGGLHFLPPGADEQNTSLEILLEFLKQEQADGVITVSVLRMDDSKRYVPGTYYYNPTGQEYLTDYYGQMRNYVYVPGYTYESLSVFLEANLYSFPEGKLLWSAQTKTVDLRDLDQGAKEVSHALVRDLMTKDILKTGTE